MARSSPVPLCLSAAPRGGVGPFFARGLCRSSPPFLRPVLFASAHAVLAPPAAARSGFFFSSVRLSAALRQPGPFFRPLLFSAVWRLFPSFRSSLSFVLSFAPCIGCGPFLCMFLIFFLFIVLGASIGRYRRREGYRLRRNTVQPVWMGDAGGAVNIILEMGLVKKERVGNRTDLAEGVREKRGTRGEGGPREGVR